MSCLSAPARWAWLLDGRTHGRPAPVHAEGCPNATDRAHPLGTMAALDALARPGTTACTVCDATGALLTIFTHGQNDVPAPATDRRSNGRGRDAVVASVPRPSPCQSRHSTESPSAAAHARWLMVAVQ
ncbi:DUF6233 domain-containing protein [Streptomyces sp. NBC_01207]|uniref:DUF6233 domain-containing protein n=1 Tax=Streptomyces sp. NBC_01207 TaxID=2903772 RepID=UPI002E0D93FB|nr:DUF6233 domain-containing protein [Streptomyces sp. NBC_01207]